MSRNNNAYKANIERVIDHLETRVADTLDKSKSFDLMGNMVLCQKYAGFAEGLKYAAEELKKILCDW